MSSKISIGQRVGWLVTFYLAWSVMLMGFQIFGMSTHALLAVAATGAGLSLIGGIRLARSVDQVMNKALETRLAAGLYQMRITAAHMAHAQLDGAELSSQAAEVAQLAEDLLSLASTGRTAAESGNGMLNKAQAVGISHGGTDDISDFWELSNPH